LVELSVPFVIMRGTAGANLRVNTKSPSTKTNDGGNVSTPEAKQLRSEKNINSPRGAGNGKKLAFPSDPAAGPPLNIMTQVQKDDEDERITDKQRQISEGRCCGWLCCYGKPTTPDKASAGDSTQDGSSVAMTQTPNQARPNEKDKNDVVPAPAGGGQDYREDSVSSSAAPEGLLGTKKRTFKGKKCLVLDLDETLVHSSFKPVPDADFIVPVEIEQVVYKVYVLKRPGVDEFLEEVAKHYEVVIFTASLSLYANPLLDMLDTQNVIAHRLFRESCSLHGQAYVKDMSKLGRKMKDIIIVDNSPLSYAFQPTSAIPITSWFDDRADRQLYDLLPVLKTTLKEAKDVRDILDANNKSFSWLCNQSR